MAKEKTMFTRKQYLDKECTHAEYYGQFVNNRTRQTVKNVIGIERLRASTDQFLNDIPLHRWDNMPLSLNSQLMTDAGDWLSPAGKVCILKEAARQLIREAGE